MKTVLECHCRLEHSARVPLVYGVVDHEDLESVYKVASVVYNDSFLKMYITEIFQNENKEISLKMRLLDFEVLVGNLDNLEMKVKKFKSILSESQKKIIC